MDNIEKRCANIFLISDSDFEYEALVNAGFKNITRFVSKIRAYEYLNAHSDVLKSFDVVLRGSSAVGNREYDKYNFNISNLAKLYDVPQMCFYSAEVGDELRFYVSKPFNNSHGFNLRDFLTMLDDVIPDDLKNSKVTIFKSLEKKKELPKSLADVKVLFMGYAINYDLVREYFLNQGVKDCTFIESGNGVLEANLENIQNYDLVVADMNYSYTLLSLTREFHDYLKDKTRNSYFVVYDLERGSANKNHVMGASTEILGDDKVISFFSVDTEDNKLKDILGCVLSLYAGYNKNIKGEYPTQEQLDLKYMSQLDEQSQMREVMDAKFGVVRNIINELITYRNSVRDGSVYPHIEGLRVDILADGASVAFLVGEREAVRFTFKDSDIHHDGKLIFYLEYLNNNGKMINALKRIVCCSVCYNDLTNITSEEMKKIEAINKRIDASLSPKLRENAFKPKKAHVQQRRKPSDYK